MFENKTHFPRFYRLVPIAEDFADGFVALVKKLKWHRVAVLSYDEDFVFNVKFCVECLSLYCTAQYTLFSMATKLTCYFIAIGTYIETCSLLY